MAALLQSIASKCGAGEGADINTSRPSNEQRIASYSVAPERQSKMTMNLISITAAQATTIVIETCFSLATDISPWPAAAPANTMFRRSRARVRRSMRLRGFPTCCCLSGEIAPRTTHNAVPLHNDIFLHRQHTQQVLAPFSRTIAHRRAAKHVSDSAGRLMRAVALCRVVGEFGAVRCGSFGKGEGSRSRAPLSLGGQVWTSSRPRGKQRHFVEIPKGRFPPALAR